MVPPRREQKPRHPDSPPEPSPYDGPENAKEAQRQGPPARKRQIPKDDGQTRGKDQTAREMTAEAPRTRGRDQIAREMTGGKQR